LKNIDANFPVAVSQAQRYSVACISGFEMRNHSSSQGRVTQDNGFMKKDYCEGSTQSESHGSTKCPSSTTCRNVLAMVQYLYSLPCEEGTRHICHSPTPGFTSRSKYSSSSQNTNIVPTYNLQEFPVEAMLWCVSTSKCLQAERYTSLVYLTDKFWIVTTRKPSYPVTLGVSGLD
jgi:hypothetical protein